MADIFGLLWLHQYIEQVMDNKYWLITGHEYWVCYIILYYSIFLFNHAAWKKGRWEM